MSPRPAGYVVQKGEGAYSQYDAAGFQPPAGTTCSARTVVGYEIERRTAGEWIAGPRSSLALRRIPRTHCRQPGNSQNPDQKEGVGRSGRLPVAFPVWSPTWRPAGTPP